MNLSNLDFNLLKVLDALVSERNVTRAGRRLGRSQPAVSNALQRLRVLLGDDLLACVLGGVYTDVEKTMIELQRSTLVQETRSAFQNAMQRRFIDEVERLSGRDVLAFISNQHVGPDIEIELFVLRDPA